MTNSSPSASPKWGNSTKIVVGLTAVAVLAFFLTQFRDFIGPILLAFVLAYLMHPPATFLCEKLRFSWRLSVSLIFIALLLILAGLITWGGLALIEQLQSLILFLQSSISNLPAFIDKITAKPIVVGNIPIDLVHLDLLTVYNQVAGWIQPIFSQMGSLAGNIATSAATTLGWMFFILILSYFILAETKGRPDQLISVRIPGYSEDLKKLGFELNRIWNAFLRGQLTIILIGIVVYTFLLGSMGVHYFFGLALLAGMARFLPYLGPAIAWTTYALVCYFQGPNIFGLTPLAFALMVVGIAWLTDALLDNLVGTPIMANALRVHPAAVIVAALVGAKLLGLIGVILASPVLATLKLAFDYGARKMFDLDPWAGSLNPGGRQAPFSWRRAIKNQWLQFSAWLRSRFSNSR